MADQAEAGICTGFEFGTLFESQAGGTKWFDALSGDISIQSTTKRSGTYALKCSPTAATPAVVLLEHVALITIVGRYYIRFATLPTVDMFLAYENAGGSIRSGLSFNAATGKFRAFQKAGSNAATFSTDGPTAATGVWYQIDYEVKVDSATSPDTHTINWQVDGVVQAALVTLVDAATYTSFVYGNGGSSPTSAAEFYIDDHVMVNFSVNLEPSYPIGSGQVSLLQVDGVGTHLNAGHFTDSNANSPPVNPHLLVDELPIATTDTDYVSQTTIDVTSYLEFTLSALPAGAPDEVHGVSLAGSFSNALAADMTARLVAAGVTIGGSLTSANTNSQIYGFNGLTRSGLWTVAELNGAVIRAGFSNDVTPSPRMHNVWVEVAHGPVGETSGGQPEPRPFNPIFLEWREVPYRR